MEILSPLRCTLLPAPLQPSVSRSEMLSLFTQKQSYATLYAKHVAVAVAVDVDVARRFTVNMAPALAEHQKQKISPQTAWHCAEVSLIR